MKNVLAAMLPRFTTVPGLAVALGYLTFVSGLVGRFDHANRRLMTGVAVILLGVAWQYFEDWKYWNDSERRWRVDSICVLLGVLFFAASVVLVVCCYDLKLTGWRI